MVPLLSIIKRDFFIVFDRNLESRKESVFNINFFYLKSFKKENFTFTYLNKPFFRGTVEIGLDFKDKIRPLNFNKIQMDNVLDPINPRLFKRFLLSDKNKFIAFSSQTDPSKFSPIRNMLKSFQYDEKNIKRLIFCKSCLEKKRFNILGEKAQIKSFNNRYICSECALNIVIREGKVSGLISSDRINPKLKNFFNHMILKFKNVEKVLKSFRADFDPTRNKRITLYDIEKNPPLSKKYLNYEIDNLDIPDKFRNLLKRLNILTLLPIQAISIEKGLINAHKNQLIMAPTSAGKTLVGELAGITRVLRDGLKMIYLVPIVALANVRTEEFGKKYKTLGLKVIKKVGESLLYKIEDDDLDELINADVIIATYEAIDYILRSGNKEKLGKIGSIIIDEIQTLIDSDRGFILDGLISRLKTLYTEAQFLYLSATIGEPESLAKKLECILIRYNNRPVPIERHLILCLNETLKHKFIVKLIRSANSEKSKYGFKGQSIVFTNSRKKCESLTEYLQNRGLKVRAYHSGLTNEERKIIESDFQSQKLAGVVATAALAAGVDFPAKQVIFESLAMGINFLTVAEFEQMLGRAGRLKKHEIGYAYILVEPGKIYSPKMKLTEENIAINLLNGKIKDFELEPDEDKSLTELLSFISMYNKSIEREEIYVFYENLINGDYDLEKFLNKLKKLKLVQTQNNFSSVSNQLGRAIAKSFLTVDKSLDIINSLKKKTKKVIDIVLELKPLKNVYLSKTVVADLSKNINMKYFSNNFFSASVLSLMDAEYVKKRKKFSQKFIDYIIKWTKEIFNCKCSDNPYCECGRLNLEKIIFRLRTEEGLSIKEISEFLELEFKILVFKGDIIDYLENLIYSFESILNISRGITADLDPSYEKELLDVPHIIESIKNLQ